MGGELESTIGAPLIVGEAFRLLGPEVWKSWRTGGAEIPVVKVASVPASCTRLVAREADLGRVCLVKCIAAEAIRYAGVFACDSVLLKILSLVPASEAGLAIGRVS